MPPAVGEWWGRTWPGLLGAAVVLLVGAPAAVASYLHAREVVGRHDPVMSPWLPLSVDGMLLAALVVMWVRRRRGVAVGAGPWAAFAFGMVVTVAANLAAVDQPGVEGYIVALFPPLALAVALELVALVAGRTAPDQTTGPDEQTTPEPAPVHAVAEVVQTALEGGPTTPGLTDRAAADHTDRPEPVQAGPGPDLQATTPTDDVDPLLDEVVAWAADRTGPLSGRQLRSEFRVGPDRARRLLDQLAQTTRQTTEKESLCSTG